MFTRPLMRRRQAARKTGTGDNIDRFVKEKGGSAFSTQSSLKSLSSTQSSFKGVTTSENLSAGRSGGGAKFYHGEDRSASHEESTDVATPVTNEDSESFLPLSLYKPHTSWLYDQQYIAQTIAFIGSEFPVLQNFSPAQFLNIGNDEETLSIEFPIQEFAGQEFAPYKAIHSDITPLEVYYSIPQRHEVLALGIYDGVNKSLSRPFNHSVLDNPPSTKHFASLNRMPPRRAESVVDLPKPEDKASNIAVMQRKEDSLPDFQFDLTTNSTTGVLSDWIDDANQSLKDPKSVEITSPTEQQNLLVSTAKQNRESKISAQPVGIESTGISGMSASNMILQESSTADKVGTDASERTVPLAIKCIAETTHSSRKANSGEQEHQLSRHSTSSVPLLQPQVQKTSTAEILQQVGSARIRLEIVTLSKHPATYSSTPENSAQVGSKRRGNYRKQSGSQDGNDKNKRRRRRTEVKAPDTEFNSRFACPYQAYDQSQDCLKRGPRNPNGGCKGISRLKQHFNRRHVLAYRCKRCWSSFDTKEEASEHEQLASCTAKDQPQNEYFMSSQDELVVKSVCTCPDEVDMWWHFFQILIPGMRDRDVESLRALYFPYYIHFETSFLIPSLTIQETLLQPMPSMPSTTQPSLHPSEATGSFSPPFPDLSSTAPEGTSFPVQNFLVPIYQVNPQQTQSPCQFNSNTGQPSITDTPVQPSNLASGSLPVGSATISLEPTSQSSDQTQLRQNYQRLQLRNSRTETENTQLLEARLSNRTEIGRANSILDEIFAMENVPNEIYERLTQVSNILDSINERLR
ncbi:hypothetical protein B7463_g11680, partial [Scytalidium lignicola]